MATKNYAESWMDFYTKQNDVINFTAGDYTSIKECIKQYITKMCPEDFNDWANSGEVGIFVNGLSYLGSIINYRVDLNAHDIFPSTTTRRESLLNFVKMLSYSPKRNIAANGLAKLNSIKTTQSVYDSYGTSLKNVTILWNDAANLKWKEQFLTVLNSALTSTNPYGKPLKKSTVESVTTQLYELNSLKNEKCAFPFTSTVNGSTQQFEVVNPDIDMGLDTIYEKTPIPEQAFNILYRNDGAGNSSNNTGFFVFWKQGTLKNQISQISERIENNYINVNAENINNEDVWFTKIDSENGLTKEVWEKIPATEYLVYNNLDIDIRNIYKVETKDNDRITLRFSDGKFGTIPFGYYKTWYRVSNGNESLYIRPSDIKNVSITIPYMSNNTADKNVYYLTMDFSVVSNGHINQCVAQESNEYIRERAPQVFSTQNRMVTSQDYNYFPKSLTQKIKLLKSIERTYSGNTRYIDFNDPTGTYQGLQLIGEDGYMYKYSSLIDITFPVEAWTTSNDFIENINVQMRKMTFHNFYYNNFMNESSSEEWIWNDIYSLGTNTSKGYFTTTGGELISYNTIVSKLPQNSLVKFVSNKTSKESWCKIVDVVKLDNISGVDYEITINDTLGLDELWTIKVGEGYDPFIATVPNNLKDQISSYYMNSTSFGLRYQYKDTYNNWEIVPFDALSDGDFVRQYQSIQTEGGCTDWLIKCEYNTSNNWTITIRSTDYLFGSSKGMSFFFNTSSLKEDGTFETNDYIKILKYQDKLEKPFTKDFYWKPCNTLLSSDGYVDNTKFMVYGYDNDKDSTEDNPKQFVEMINENKSNLFFSRDEVSGNESILNNVVEMDSMWDSLTNGSHKGFPSLRVSGYYYLKKPCTIYPAGTVIPNYELGIKGHDIKITKTTILSNGQTITASLSNPYVIVRGRAYTFDVVDDGYIVEYDDVTHTVVSEEYSEKNSLVYWNASTKELNILDDNKYVKREGINNLLFMWKHYATSNYLIDPSTTNIIDMYVLTQDYYNEVQSWLSNGKTDKFPKLPSSYTLKSMFNELENYKMATDTMVWHPISYKVLFGQSAPEELRGIFKIIKNTSTTLSDNEIKQRVVDAIDEYFASMSAGEKFYFTKLSSYIHDKVGNNNIDTVLLVPTFNREKFGDLFEIMCEPEQTLISGATIDDIQIITTITEYNIRM